MPHSRTGAGARTRRPARRGVRGGRRGGHRHEGRGRGSDHQLTSPGVRIPDGFYRVGRQNPPTRSVPPDGAGSPAPHPVTLPTRTIANERRDTSGALSRPTAQSVARAHSPAGLGRWRHLFPAGSGESWRPGATRPWSQPWSEDWPYQRSVSRSESRCGQQSSPIRTS